MVQISGFCWWGWNLTPSWLNYISPFFSITPPVKWCPNPMSGGGNLDDRSRPPRRRLPIPRRHNTSLGIERWWYCLGYDGISMGFVMTIVFIRASEYLFSFNVINWNYSEGRYLTSDLLYMFCFWYKWLLIGVFNKSFCHAVCLHKHEISDDPDFLECNSYIATKTYIMLW